MSSLPFPITYPEGAPMEQLLKSPLIKEWADSVNPRLEITKVDVVTADSFGRRIGFIELDVFYTVNSVSHQERIILTGKSVMVAVVLKCIEDSKLYSVLVHQPRIGCGRIMYEFPAGMTDDAHDFRAVGARELREEVGLDCGADDLIPLSELFRPERPFAYLNTSHYDEAIHLFMIAREMHRDEIFTFEGKHCGADHDEQITLHVVLFDDVWRYSDEPATLVAQFMVRDVIRRGVVKL